MQGKGLARPLIAHTLRRLRALGYGEIFVSTQTTTWVAARLYMVSASARPRKTCRKVFLAGAS